MMKLDGTQDDSPPLVLRRRLDGIPAVLRAQVKLDKAILDVRKYHLQHLTCLDELDFCYAFLRALADLEHVGKTGE